LKNDITVNILGSCVSRNIFNEKIGKKYTVKGYIQNQYPLLLSQKCDKKYCINDFDIKIANNMFTHNFNRRMLKSTLNGNAEDLLLSNKGNWMIIDTHYLYCPLAIVKYPEGKRLIFQSRFAPFVKKMVSSNAKYKDCKAELVDASVNILHYINEFAEFIRNNWGNKVIIIINSPPAPYQLRDCKVVHDYYKYGYESQNGKLAEELTNSLDCYYIDMPFAPIKTGNVEVHYVKLIRQYLKEMVDCITDFDEDKEKNYKLILKSNKIRAKYSTMIGEIINDAYLPLYEIRRKLMDSLERNGNCESTLNIFNKLIS